MDRKRSLESLSLIAFAIALVLSLPLVAGFFGAGHPALDSLAHFRVHLAVVMIVFAALALAGSMWRQGLMAIAFGLTAIGTTLGIQSLGQVHAAIHPKDDASPTYRMLQMNLRFDNAEPGKVLSMIGRIRPDVITLDEVSKMWAQKLDLLSSAYPHRIVCPLESHAGGVAILSQRPFAGEKAARCIGGVLAIADVDFGGRLVQVGALHLSWPWPFDQSEQIDGLAGPLGEMAETAILGGDLNATPWSAAAKRIADEGAFQPVKFAGPTWLYRGLPEALRFAGLPIDHIFAKGDVMVHSARTLEAAGSDHLPVLMEFSLKPAPRAPETSESETVVQSSRGTPAG